MFIPLRDSIVIYNFVHTDNGGGMDPDKMRQCMSLGYSAKSKLANTIGQCQSFFPIKIILFFVSYLLYTLFF